MDITLNSNGFSSFDEGTDLYKNSLSELNVPNRAYSHRGSFLHYYGGNFQAHANIAQKIISCYPSKVSSFTESTFDFKTIFSSFIDARLNYLEGLKSLGDNWISGQSKQPSIDAIEFSKSLLKNLRSWIAAERCVITIPPKIIMSPIPSGGISIELNFSDNLSFSISISDNSRIELEKQEDGYYSEIKVTAETVLDEIITRSKDYVTSI